MSRLIRIFREYQIRGRGLAVILVVVFRRIIWHIYLSLRTTSVNYGHRYLPWIACSLYFALLLWIFLLVMNNGKRHLGMAMDSLLGGCVLSVAALLHDPDLRPVLSRKGFGAAEWVTFFAVSAVIVGNWAGLFGKGIADQRSTNKAGDADLPPE